jgi:ribosome recycling factor
MSDELDFIVEVAKDSMVKAINHLENELTRIRAGKANPQMLESVNVDYYGVPTVINQMANVSDGRQNTDHSALGKKYAAAH